MKAVNVLFCLVLPIYKKIENNLSPPPSFLIYFDDLSITYIYIYIQGVPKVRKNDFLFFVFYIIDCRLSLIFIPHIVSVTSKRSGM